MPLAYRIIPTILCRGRQLVKGRGFDSWRAVGIAMQAIQVHAVRGVDEVLLLDITATQEGRGPDLRLVEELSEFLFCPLTVGGGVRSVEDVKALLRAGADSVVIGTAAHALTGHGLIRACRDAVGSQAIVASIDVKGSKETNWELWTHSGKRRDGHCPHITAKRMEDAGAGEILLQSIERDGTGQGYDLDLIGEVSQEVGVPLIASGGAGSYLHMLQAIQAGASAVASGAMFQFEDATPKGAAQFLAKAGIEVRL